MDVFILPILAVAIVCFIAYVCVAWLGKKSDRALKIGEQNSEPDSSHGFHSD